MRVDQNDAALDPFGCVVADKLRDEIASVAAIGRVQPDTAGPCFRQAIIIGGVELLRAYYGIRFSTGCRIEIDASQHLARCIEILLWGVVFVGKMLLDQ